MATTEERRFDISMRRMCMFRNFIGLLLCLLGLRAGSSAAELKPKTTAAFDRYVAATEARFANELRPEGTFLYVDGLQPEARKSSYEQLKQGEILVEKLETKSPGVSADIPDGMVHHWVGLVFIPGVTLANTLPVVQDYDHQAELYKPDVIASRMLGHEGSDFKIFLRLYQKKFTTVVFNSEYDIHWGRVDAGKMYSDSISTRIAEVKDANQPEGEEDPVGTGRGYLWRLNTYWRFEEKDGGVYMQCEAVSLTRNIPFGLGWLLRPLVTAIPKQSLNRALGRTRQVILQQTQHNPAGTSSHPRERLCAFSDEGSLKQDLKCLVTQNDSGKPKARFLITSSCIGILAPCQPRVCILRISVTTILPAFQKNISPNQSLDSSASG